MRDIYLPPKHRSSLAFEIQPAPKRRWGLVVLWALALGTIAAWVALWLHFN